MTSIWCHVDVITTLFIGVGRFRILGEQGLDYWWGPRGCQIPSRHMTTSMRRNDVTLTSFRRHVPARFVINQCQIITFIILKPDIIENSRIDLRGIALPVPSNQIKVTFIIILPFNLVHLWFFPVSHRNWRNRWVAYLGGGGVKGYVPPPFSNYWGAWFPCPPAPLFLRLCYLPARTAPILTHRRIV